MNMKEAHDSSTSLLIPELLPQEVTDHSLTANGTILPNIFHVVNNS